MVLACTLLFDTLDNIENLEYIDTGGVLLKGIDMIPTSNFADTEPACLGKEFYGSGKILTKEEKVSIKWRYPIISKFKSKPYNTIIGDAENNHKNQPLCNITNCHAYTKLAVIVWYTIDIDNWFFRSYYFHSIIGKHNDWNVLVLPDKQRMLKRYDVFCGKTVRVSIEKEKEQLIRTCFGIDYNDYNITDENYGKKIITYMLCNNPKFYRTCDELKSFLKEADTYNACYEILRTGKLPNF